MTHKEARILFTSLIAAHINWINNEHGLGLGVRVYMGEGTEDLTAKDPTSDHMKGSLHHLGLAMDLHMDINGVYQKDSVAHAESARIWEMRHPLCRNLWRQGDGNHYSLEWEGKK
jgi:hypothetical protein